jgi:hypothetical protein
MQVAPVAMLAVVVAVLAGSRDPAGLRYSIATYQSR